MRPRRPCREQTIGCDLLDLRTAEPGVEPIVVSRSSAASRSASSPRNRRTTDTAIRWATLASAVHRSTPSENSYRPSSWTSVKSGPHATISRSASRPDTKRPPTGRPGDRDDRRVVALPWCTEPHRDDRRRRQIGFVDAGRDPRRHVVAPRRRRRARRATDRRSRRTGRPPPRTGGSDVRSRGRTPQPTFESHVTIVHPSDRSTTGSYVPGPVRVDGTFGPAQRPCSPSVRSTAWPQKIAPYWVGPRSSSRSERS